MVSEEAGTLAEGYTCSAEALQAGRELAVPQASLDSEAFPPEEAVLQTVQKEEDVIQWLGFHAVRDPPRQVENPLLQ